jgi:uncharacterized protein (DUF58 family)
MKIDANILRQLDAFSLRTRKAVLGLRQGSHRSQRRGHGVEFAEYRNYELGDNPRYIDWNLFARSDKLYIKRYLEEENVSLFIVLDASPSLTHPALRAKWEAATALTALSSYIALASQDPVVLSILGGATTSSFWGGRAFHSVKSFLQKTTDQLAEAPRNIDLANEARRAATRMTFPGICLFISDFLYPLETTAKILSAFRARNMELHAVQILGDSDMEPSPGSEGSTLLDSETGEIAAVSLDADARAQYTELLSRHNRAIRDYCLSHQVQFTAGRASTSPIDAGLEILTRMCLFV